MFLETRLILRIATPLLLLAAGCQTEIWGKDGTNGDAPAVDGGDADTDTDADADTDADPDTAEPVATGDTGTELDCEATYPTPDPGASELGSCVTQELACGDRILATLTGGSTVYDYAFWEDQGVLGPYLGQTTFLDGPERVYAFRDLMEDESVTVRVQSCFDSWATWIRYGDVSDDYCSLSTFNQGGLFEIASGRRDRSTIRINPSAPNGYDFEFQIEGIDGAEGNFLLTVECG